MAVSVSTSFIPSPDSTRNTGCDRCTRGCHFSFSHRLGITLCSTLRRGKGSIFAGVSLCSRRLSLPKATLNSFTLGNDKIILFRMGKRARGCKRGVGNRLIGAMRANIVKVVGNITSNDICSLGPSRCGRVPGEIPVHWRDRGGLDPGKGRLRSCYDQSNALSIISSTASMGVSSSFSKAV